MGFDEDFKNSIKYFTGFFLGFKLLYVHFQILTNSYTLFKNMTKSKIIT